MKLKNILIVVKDIEKSKQFYNDLFGLDLVLDNDGREQMKTAAKQAEADRGQAAPKKNAPDRGDR